MTKRIDEHDEFLILASDGLFDVMENEDVAKFVTAAQDDFVNVAKLLCNEAIRLGSSDNVTALVIDIKYDFFRLYCWFYFVNPFIRLVGEGSKTLLTSRRRK